MSSYLVLLWVHLLAAISWIGGMLFLSIVLAPFVRQRKAVPECMTVFRLAARRFRFVVWTAIVLLLGTGPLLLHERGWSLLDPNSWPPVLRMKIGLVLFLLLLTVSHDLLLGPQTAQVGAIPPGARSSTEQALVLTSLWVPRLALLVALCVVAAAIALARS